MTIKLDELTPAQYETLRRMAARIAATRYWPDPAELVNAAWLKLRKWDTTYRSWGHLRGLFRIVMRQVIIDQTRAAVVRCYEDHEQGELLDSLQGSTMMSVEAPLLLEEAFRVAGLGRRRALLGLHLQMGGYTIRASAALIGCGYSTLQRELRKLSMQHDEEKTTKHSATRAGCAEYHS